jgi:hypothetical protein
MVEISYPCEDLHKEHSRQESLRKEQKKKASMTRTERLVRYSGIQIS